MLQYLTWAGVAVALLITGWSTCAWVYQRKVNFLQVQLKVMRQTAVAHTDQARRRIGQLQAAHWLAQMGWEVAWLSDAPAAAPLRRTVLWCWKTVLPRRR